MIVTQKGGKNASFSKCLLSVQWISIQPYLVLYSTGQKNRF